MKMSNCVYITEMAKRFVLTGIIVSVVCYGVFGQNFLRLGAGLGLGMHPFGSNSTLRSASSELELKSAMTYSGRLFMENHFNRSMGLETGLGMSYSTFFINSSNNSFRDLLGWNSYVDLYSYKVVMLPFYNIPINNYSDTFLKLLGGFTLERNYTNSDLDEFGYQLRSKSKQFFSGNIQFEFRLLKKNRSGRNAEIGLSYLIPIWTDANIDLFDAQGNQIAINSRLSTLNVNLVYILGFRRKRHKSENIQPGSKHEVGRLVE